MCRAEGVCTKVDTLTGRTKHIFQRKYRKEHKVGWCQAAPAPGGRPGPVLSAAHGNEVFILPHWRPLSGEI